MSSFPNNLFRMLPWDQINREVETSFFSGDTLSLNCPEHLVKCPHVHSLIFPINSVRKTGEVIIYPHRLSSYNVAVPGCKPSVFSHQSSRAHLVCARQQRGQERPGWVFLPTACPRLQERRVGVVMHCGTFHVGSSHRILAINKEWHRHRPWEERIQRRLLGVGSHQFRSRRYPEA